MRARLALVVLTIAFLVSACGRAPARGLVFETSGAALTAADAEALAASTDISAYASVEASAGPSLRVAALERLRSEGDIGAQVADMLTKGFPPGNGSIPVLVRICTVDGTRAAVVVEAYGDLGGTITHRRLWVFRLADGSILRASSFL